MYHHPVVQVPAYCPRQHHPLKILALADHIRHAVPVRDPSDGLLDDRTSVQLRGGEMGGCTNDLDTSLVGAVVGSSTLKGRKEGMVDVDGMRLWQW